MSDAASGTSYTRPATYLEIKTQGRFDPFNIREALLMRADPYAADFDCSHNDETGLIQSYLFSAPINFRMVRDTHDGRPSTSVEFVGQSCLTLGFLLPSHPGCRWQLLQWAPDGAQGTSVSKLVDTLEQQSGFERLLLGTKITLPLDRRGEQKGFNLQFDMPYLDNDGVEVVHHTSLQSAEDEIRRTTGSFAESIGHLLAKARNLRVEGPALQFVPEYGFWARPRPDEALRVHANAEDDEQTLVDEDQYQDSTDGALSDIAEEDEEEDVQEENNQARDTYDQAHPWYSIDLGISHTLNLIPRNAKTEWYFACDQPAILTDTGDIARPVPSGVLQRHLDQKYSEDKFAVIEAFITNDVEVKEDGHVREKMAHRKVWTTPSSTGVLIRRVLGQKDTVFPISYKDTVTVQMPSPGDIWEDGQLRPADDHSQRSLTSQQVLPAITHTMMKDSEEGNSKFIKQTIRDRLLLPEHRLNQHETQVTWSISDIDTTMTLAELEDEFQRQSSSSGRPIDPRSIIHGISRIDLMEHCVDISKGFEVLYKNSSGAPITATVIASLPLNPRYLTKRHNHRHWNPTRGLQATHSRSITPATLGRVGATTLRRSGREGTLGQSARGGSSVMSASTLVERE